MKRLRIILAALCFTGLTLLFAGIGHGWWGWLAKAQMLPATLRVIGGATIGNLAVVLGILLLTMLMGRIYCSVLCPLGVFQDLIIWLRRTLGKRIKALRKRYSFNKERLWLRYPVAAAFIVCIVADLQLAVSLLEPYSAYGRMVRAVAGGGPAPLLIAAGATFLVIVLCAWIWGRAWCSNVCPVGTVLGCFSRYSLFRVYVDEDKCVKCGACQHVCKASCIDSAAQTIDGSRCIDCFDCIDFCKAGGLKYGRPGAGNSSHRQLRKREGAASETKVSGSGTDEPLQDEGRRAFLKANALLVSGATATLVAGAQEMKVDGGLAHLDAKVPVERDPRLVPPGAQSVKNFYDKCTACQLCISACPNGVLRPSTDLDHLLQPQMGYEKGFCRPECTACTDVCPSGAIRPVHRDAKTLIHVGTAVVNPDLCLAALGKAGCGKCSRECPMGAISMVDVDGHRRPAVAEELCIGCGKCEYLCPARPVSAITVKGLETHRNG